MKDVVTVTAVNPKSDQRNVLKKSDTLIPSITSSVSILLFSRNQSLNANASVNSLLLRRGKADKMCVARFNALHICVSHAAMLQKQSALGRDYLLPIKQLAKQLEDTAKDMTDKISTVLSSKNEEISIESSYEKSKSSMNLYAIDADDSFLQEAALNCRVEILDITGTAISNGSDSLSISSEESYSAAMPNWKPFAKSLQELQEQLPELSEPSAEKVNIIFNPKYVLVGDNVDIRTTRRHYLIDRGIIDRHFFNLIVVSNRIKIPDELIGVKAPKTDVLEIPISNFLPSEMDEFSLREQVKILVSRELIIKYFEELAWMKKFVISHIPHEYKNETKKKSEVVSLSIDTNLFYY